MDSEAEDEYGALFLNSQEAVPIRTTLIEMKYPHPPTPIQVENSTAVGIANKSIRQKGSKSIDMRFHWIRNRIHQKQFNVFWKPGPTNWGYYYYKNHLILHHIKMRPTNRYVTPLLGQIYKGVLIPIHRDRDGKNHNSPVGEITSATTKGGKPAQQIQYKTRGDRNPYFLGKALGYDQESYKNNPIGLTDNRAIVGVENIMPNKAPNIPIALDVPLGYPLGNPIIAELLGEALVYHSYILKIRGEAPNIATRIGVIPGNSNRGHLTQLLEFRRSTHRVWAIVWLNQLAFLCDFDSLEDFQ